GAWAQRVFIFPRRRRHTSFSRDWSSDVCSSDLYRIKQHDGNRMQGKEPAPGLIHAFGNEVGREILFEKFPVFKRVVPLRIRHGSRIEPYVNQIGFPEKLLTALADQHDGVHMRTVQIVYAAFEFI